MARTVKSWSQQAATLPNPVRLRGALPFFVKNSSACTQFSFLILHSPFFIPFGL